MKKFLLTLSLFTFILICFTFITTNLLQSPSIKQETSETQWPTYSSFEISFKYPPDWTVGEMQVYGSSNETEFTDPNGKYKLFYYERINYNQETGKPYSNFIEFIKIPYLKPIKTIGTYELYQVLPRAGSEHINSVDLFANEKTILTIELETVDQNDEDVKTGQKIFSTIVGSIDTLK